MTFRSWWKTLRACGLLLICAACGNEASNQAGINDLNDGCDFDPQSIVNHYKDGTIRHHWECDYEGEDVTFIFRYNGEFGQLDTEQGSYMLEWEESGCGSITYRAIDKGSVVFSSTMTDIQGSTDLGVLFFTDTFDNDPVSVYCKLSKDIN